jgi:hypothetical protein
MDILQEDGLTMKHTCLAPGLERLFGGVNGGLEKFIVRLGNFREDLLRRLENIASKRWKLQIITTVLTGSLTSYHLKLFSPTFSHFPLT